MVDAKTESSTPLIDTIEAAITDGRLQETDPFHKVAEVLAVGVSELPEQEFKTVGDLIASLKPKVGACIDIPLEGAETTHSVKATEVLSAIKTIKKGKDLSGIPETTFQFLIENGLLEQLLKDQLLKIKKQIKEEESGSTATNNSIRPLEDQLEELEQKLDSRWHRIFGDKETLKTERTEKERLKAEIQKLKKSVSDSKTKLAELKASIAGFKEAPANIGTVKVSKKGETRAEQLDARSERLANSDYDSIDKEIETTESAINAAYERFMEFYKKLNKLGYTTNSETIEFALSLSGIEGTQEEVMERAMVVNDYFHKNNWQSYDRLKIAGSVARQKGDIHELTKELARLFRILFEKDSLPADIYRGYTTWELASQMIGIQGETAKEKHSRLHSVLGALSSRGWSDEGGTLTNSIAATLAKKQGDPEALAEEFRNFELELCKTGKKAGVKDCRGSGVATLILMSRGGDKQAKIRRFVETFNGYQPIPTKVSQYSETARISLMPGTLKENYLWMCQLMKRLEIDGFKQDLRERALNILDRSWGTLMKEFMANYQTHVNAIKDAETGVEGNSSTEIDFTDMMICLYFLSEILDTNIQYENGIPTLDFESGTDLQGTDSSGGLEQEGMSDFGGPETGGGYDFSGGDFGGSDFGGGDFGGGGGGGGGGGD